jgi:hypothetical protein
MKPAVEQAFESKSTIEYDTDRAGIRKNQPALVAWAVRPGRRRLPDGNDETRGAFRQKILS